MMQNNSDFTPRFAKVVAPLRKLLNEEGFCWTHMHKKTFDELLKMFFLSYFDMTITSYIFTELIKLDLVLFYAKE